MKTAANLIDVNSYFAFIYLDLNASSNLHFPSTQADLKRNTLIDFMMEYFSFSRRFCSCSTSE
ncbi:hypothetical protein X798_00128 [Onchocerca flexuosa]|uniref:Uncharacterized protein n=1 Tax=Onchocerca flexuosa TaxID=387005 RepID=A0A238C4V7_9BILA|nr:hypothetical protein X798_00128 [Onchocerca flexuosa]